MESASCGIQAQTASVDVVQRGKQRSPRGPGGDRRDQDRLRRQRQVARRAQRKRSQQRRELIPDGGAGEPAADRFGEPEPQHRNAAADPAALEAKPQKMPLEAVGYIAVAGADEMQ